CSRKEACQKWELPQHFSTELKQCVDITVTPANMSVTSASTQQTSNAHSSHKQPSETGHS
ncbi:plexin A3, partial [Tachysurus ichikawai]